MIYACENKFFLYKCVLLDLINEIDVFPTYFGELAMVKGDVSPTLVGQIGPRDRWSPPE